MIPGVVEVAVGDAAPCSGGACARCTGQLLPGDACAVCVAVDERRAAQACTARVLYGDTLPEQVVEALRTRGYAGVRVNRVAAVSKAAADRGVAWDLVRVLARRGRQHGWRKVHTRHYWAWYLLDQESRS